MIKTNINDNPHELKAKMPKGTIKAKIMKDDECPGITTLTDDP